MQICAVYAETNLAIASHLDTLADRLLDSVTHYMPAEILLPCAVLILSFAGLLYAASWLSVPDDHSSPNEDDNQR